MVRKATPNANPKRVAAGKRNVLKRKGLTPEGRERLRAAALAQRPWERSTGPRTPEGKARSSANGRATQKGALSVRQLRAELAEVRLLVATMRDGRRRLEGRSRADSRAASAPPRR
jgi:hypothetical protein